MGIERLARNRRVAAFYDASELRPIKTPETCPLLEVIWRKLYCDHTSVWTSDLGTQFVLNEPYGEAYIKEEDKLRDAGLVCIQLPTPLAPYCGKWSSASSALPETRSFLIGFKRDEVELLKIAAKLKAAAECALEWNSTVGLE